MPHFFITAVGTEIGKTLVTTILSHQLTARSEPVTTLKPIVSGFDPKDPMNDPALILQSLGESVTPEVIAAITPWRFRAPISPHLAARREGRPIDLDHVTAFCRRHEKADAYLLIEGAGGLMSPLNDHATNLDLIQALGYPVIVVTGTYLGALSHTLTAYETLKTRTVPIQAIIVSESTPSAGFADTLETLQAFTAPDQLILPLPRLSGTPDKNGPPLPRSSIQSRLITQIETTSRSLSDPNRMPQPAWFDPGLRHIWLPYCQMKVAPPPLPVVRTHGCRLVLADGRELIDGIASWWSVCHGYNHPHIQHAVAEQLATMPHVMFGGLAHEPAFRLANRLINFAPPGLTRVFFTDSGSIAVEVALKIALQYWRNVGETSKTRFLCFTNGYHGDTLGAMSVSDPENSLHHAFQSTLPAQPVVDIPTTSEALTSLDRFLAAQSRTIAAVIIEPLVQGAGGMKFHSPEDLANLHRLAAKHHILFIADEIATGFYRTGTRFACDQAQITPDILCLGKALTGGTLTMGATLAREEIFAAFLSDDWSAALMHGPTFMANPLACAAANASLDLFETEPRELQARAIETTLQAALEPCRSLPNVVDVRVKGAIAAIQLDRSMDVFALRPRFVALGVWIRPFGDVVYLMPPLVISSDELHALSKAIRDVLLELS